MYVVVFVDKPSDRLGVNSGMPVIVKKNLCS